MRRDEMAEGRDEPSWWLGDRKKDLVAGFVLGFLSAGVADWVIERVGLQLTAML
jgi:hypothetical protein